MAREREGERTLVVGDMHCKEEVILPRVDAAVERLGCGRVVFCGDYVDEWHSSILTMRDAIRALRSWVLERRADGLAVDLVAGNHDLQYRLREPGPGTHTALFDEVARLMDELDVRAAATVGEALVTHAGVTRAWANDCLDLAEGADTRPSHSSSTPCSTMARRSRCACSPRRERDAADGSCPGPSGQIGPSSAPTPCPASTRSSGTRPWPPSRYAPSAPGTAGGLPPSSPSATRSA